MLIVHTYLGQQHSFFPNFNQCWKAPRFILFRDTERQVLCGKIRGLWTVTALFRDCCHSFMREQYLFLTGLMMQSYSEWPDPRLSSLRLHRKNKRKPKKTSNTSVCLTVLNTDIARLVTSYSEQRRPGTSCHELKTGGHSSSTSEYIRVYRKAGRTNSW
jgi:hypothetical protein